MRVAVITSSDSGYAGKREDVSGPVIEEMVTEYGYEVVHRELLPDDLEMLRDAMSRIADEDMADLILTTGGTGFSPRDVMPEATTAASERLVPGIPEAMAAHVWFTETERPYGRPARKSTVLGIHDGVAYALLYNGILGDRSVGGGNVLTKKTLKVIQEDRTAAGIGEVKKLVVYAEACRLSADTLAAEKIVFRQTPYDLVVRR